MNNKEILELISKSIHEADPNAEAWLFGSRARGDNREDSDWDVVILVDDDRVNYGLDNKFLDGFCEIELEFGQIITPFIYTKKHWYGPMSFSPLYKNVLKEGLKLW